MGMRNLSRVGILACALWAASAFGARSGTWTATIRDATTVSLQLYTDQRDRTSSHGHTVALRELRGLSADASGDAEFRIEREAGTLTLRGRFEDRKGAGHFTFQEDPRFRPAMAALGFPEWTDEEVFILFGCDTGPSRVKALRELGYANFSKDALIQVALFDVTPEVIRGYADVGYSDLPLDELIKLRIHRIDPAWIERMRGAVRR